VKTGCAVCALVLSFASPILAQTARPERPVPPQDVLTSVRSMGLDPATRPLMRGRVYVLRAFDASHAEKRVLVDAHSAKVLSVRATADAGPAETPYNPRYGRYDPPRPPASVARGAEAPDSEPILDEPLFPRAGRGAPAAAPAQRSAAPAPTPPTPKAQPSAPVNTAEDNKAPVGTSPASAGEATMNAAAASPLPPAEVLAGASSSPGKSVPAPVAAKASTSSVESAAKPATEFVPVAPLE
jgi:hypothetical protein